MDHYDLFQTLCDVAQVQQRGSKEWQARHYPGRSYLPMLRGEAIPEWDDTRYGELGDTRMIRTRDYKLVFRHPAGPHEFFDLRNDPGETINRADDPDYQTIRADLERRMAEWYGCHEDPQKSGLRVKELPVHNPYEPWRDGLREKRGLQIY